MHGNSKHGSSGHIHFQVRAQKEISRGCVLVVGEEGARGQLNLSLKNPSRETPLAAVLISAGCTFSQGRFFVLGLFLQSPLRTDRGTRFDESNGDSRRGSFKGSAAGSKRGSLKGSASGGRRGSNQAPQPKPFGQDWAYRLGLIELEGRRKRASCM